MKINMSVSKQFSVNDICTLLGTLGNCLTGRKRVGGAERHGALRELHQQVRSAKSLVHHGTDSGHSGLYFRLKQSMYVLQVKLKFVMGFFI